MKEKQQSHQLDIDALAVQYHEEKEKRWAAEKQLKEAKLMYAKSRTALDASAANYAAAVTTNNTALECIPVMNEKLVKVNKAIKRCNKAADRMAEENDYRQEQLESAHDQLAFANEQMKCSVKQWNKNCGELAEMREYYGDLA